jgi:hypothetical protein
LDIVLGDDSTEVTTIFLLMKRAKLVKEPASAKALHIYCQNPMIPILLNPYLHK